jgi:hypothetical protein
MSSRLNMSRSARRGLAVVGAAVFAVSLSVGGAGSALAHPRGPIESMSDMKGVWLTPLTGFREGDPINWMHRLTVRKVNGSTAVAWEEWLDCTLQAADCKAAKSGKVAGDGWSTATRVLMAMDPKRVVYGVGATGTLMITPGETGMTAVMLSHGKQDSGAATSNPTTSGQSPSTSNRIVTDVGFDFGTSYAAQAVKSTPC